MPETWKNGCKSAGTLLELNWECKSTQEDPLIDNKKYQRLVGKLIYLLLTRPNIIFAVSVTSQFVHALSQRHFDVVNHILRYLEGTPRKRLLFWKTYQRRIESYANAD